MHRPPRNAVTRLGELLSNRMGSTRRLSLYEAFVAEGGSFEPDAELVAHLVAHREELSSWMSAALGDEPGGGGWERSPAAVLRGLLVPWLHEKNQFLRVHEEAARQLEALYRRAILDAARVLSSPVADARAAEELRGVWRAHRGRLESFARDQLGEEPRDAVCAGYSSSLQLAVLGLAAESMAEPVLDVGCGRDAALVGHLRRGGVEAHGIDRIAPEGVEGVLAADWLDFDYGDGAWGTVVSHLGRSPTPGPTRASWGRCARAAPSPTPRRSRSLRICSPPRPTGANASPCRTSSSRPPCSRRASARGSTWPRPRASGGRRSAQRGYGERTAEVGAAGAVGQRCPAANDERRGPERCRAGFPETVRLLRSIPPHLEPNIPARSDQSLDNNVVMEYGLRGGEALKGWAGDVKEVVFTSCKR
jgi:hypothetical protein